MSPKMLQEKNEERENRKSEGERKQEKKKSNGCTPSSYVDFSGDFFLKEKDCLRGELYFGCNVIKKSSLSIYIFLTLAANRNLIKKDIFQKLMIK